MNRFKSRTATQSKVTGLIVGSTLKAATGLLALVSMVGCSFVNKKNSTVKLEDTADAKKADSPEFKYGVQQLLLMKVTRDEKGEITSEPKSICNAVAMGDGWALTSSTCFVEGNEPNEVWAGFDPKLGEFSSMMKIEEVLKQAVKKPVKSESDEKAKEQEPPAEEKEEQENDAAARAMLEAALKKNEGLSPTTDKCAAKVTLVRFEKGGAALKGVTIPLLSDGTSSHPVYDVQQNILKYENTATFDVSKLITYQVPRMMLRSGGGLVYLDSKTSPDVAIKARGSQLPDWMTVLGSISVPKAVVDFDNQNIGSAVIGTATSEGKKIFVLKGIVTDLEVVSKQPVLQIATLDQCKGQIQTAMDSKTIGRNLPYSKSPVSKSIGEDDGLSTAGK